MNRPIPFLTACALEASLLGMASLWGWLFDYSIAPGLKPGFKPTLMAVCASLPPLGVFLWTLSTNWQVLSQHKNLVTSHIKPMFAGWSIVQLAIISILAGICEEAFFRMIQGSLAARVGIPLALILSSLLFGAAHLLTWTYGIMATLMGAYLALLWNFTANLSVPMITHAVYDFLALVYLVRIYRRTS